MRSNLSLDGWVEEFVDQLFRFGKDLPKEIILYNSSMVPDKFSEMYKFKFEKKLRLEIEENPKYKGVKVPLVIYGESKAGIFSIDLNYFYLICGDWDVG